MQLVKVSMLIPHPRNTEFFENMSGNRWNDFLESVRTSGIIEPVVVTEKMVIVSGHQRVRACIELGIEEVMADIRFYGDDETKILKDLVETNIRQRGTIDDGDELIGRRWRFLKEVYGVKLGNNGKSEKEDGNRVPILQDKSENGVENAYADMPPDNTHKSRDELASEFGKSRKSLDFAERLQDLPEPIREAVKEGRITSKIATRVIATLSQEEQEAIANEICDKAKHEGRISTPEMQSYIDAIKSRDERISALEALKAAAEQKADMMEREAVDATKAVKASEDSERYMAMHDELEQAKEESRHEYENSQKLREQMKKSQAESQDKIDALQQKIAEAEAKEKETAKRIRELEKIETAVIRSKDVIHLDPAEVTQAKLELRFQQITEEFLCDFDGMEMGAEELFERMNIDTRENTRGTLGRIAEIAQGMCAILDKKVEVA